MNNINLNKPHKVNISDEDIIEEKIQETIDLNTNNKIDNHEEPIESPLEKN